MGRYIEFVSAGSFARVLSAVGLKLVSVVAFRGLHSNSVERIHPRN